MYVFAVQSKEITIPWHNEYYPAHCRCFAALIQSGILEKEKKTGAKWDSETDSGSVNAPTRREEKNEHTEHK